MAHQTVSSEMQQCIKTCFECADVCLRTSNHCLHMGGEHAAPEHQCLLQDCVDICTAAARFMDRSSHHHTCVCRECAEICRECAEDCLRVGNGDTQMRQCAEFCTRCAESCEHMAAAGV